MTALGLVMMVLCGSATTVTGPATGRYASLLAEAGPETAEEVVRTAQSDVDGQARRSMATLAESSRRPGVITPEGRSALVVIGMLRLAAAAEMVVPLLTAEAPLGSEDDRPLGGSRVTGLHPAWQATVEIGAPALPYLDRQAARSDADLNCGLCAQAYRNILGSHSTVPPRQPSAAAIRLTRLISTAADAQTRERYRIIQRSLLPQPAFLPLGRWSAERQADYAAGPPLPPWCFEQKRYQETMALLGSLEKWLDDSTQHFRALAAIRILAIMRSPEAAPLLCKRLTYINQQATPGASLGDRYPAVAALSAIGHPVLGALVTKIRASDVDIELRCEAVVLTSVLDGKEEARAFLAAEAEAARLREFGRGAPDQGPSERLKALAESEWLKGGDPPLVVKP
ncbi:MAG: hypothetical protein HZB16_20900 [Armatimonadetes bacterium]|nr:hypothetical protein [Armatimonadota bacterium]